MLIDAGISDLFFNLDFDDCKVMAKGQFVSFNNDAVWERAQWFCETLARSTNVAVDPTELVKDFYNRV